MRSRSPRGYRENFSRAVRVTGREESSLAPIESITGAISRVRLEKIHERHTTFPAGLGVNLQKDAAIEVAIENGGDAALSIAAVKLQMRQRSICFTAPPVPVALFYGDANLPAPRFGADTRQPTQQSATQVMLGLEIRNPAYSEREDTQVISGRRSNLLWLSASCGPGIRRNAGTACLAASVIRLFAEDGRGERIRTSDPLVPNQVRYQTALRPERFSCRS